MKVEEAITEHNGSIVGGQSPWFEFSIDEIMKECKKMLFLGTPLAVAVLLVFLLQVISLMFVGHLGTLPLAGASMAVSFSSVTGFAVLRGMGGALDTFCGQSYGVQDYRTVGVHMQSGALALLLVCFPIAALWANTGNILRLIGQPAAISNQAGHYTRFLIPALFGYAIQTSHLKFLQSQRIVTPVMIFSAITFVGHCLWSYLLVFKSGLGNNGAAVGLVITVWFNTIMLVAFVRLSPSCKRSLVGISWEAVHGIPSFLRLAFPSAIMSCLKLWIFEATILLSGLLPNPVLETSALSISLNTCAMIYMIAVGLSSATSTLVSNELGAGNPRAARLAVVASVSLIVIEGVLTSTILIVFRRFWITLFTKDSALAKFTAKLLILVGMNHIVDGVECILSGSCRGSGRQKRGAIVNLFAYYALGLPCSVILGFVLHLGGQGFWIGIIVAMVAQTIGLGILTLRTNWQEEAKRARERNMDRTKSGETTPSF